MVDYEKFFAGKKVMITGGLGFIGSNLAHRLVKLNPEKIVIVDSLIPGLGGNLFNIRGLEEKLSVYSGKEYDLRNTSTMIDLLNDVEFIFNLAGSVSHIGSINDPASDLELNLKSHVSLLEACRKHVEKKGIPLKIVYAATRDQYGKVPERDLPVKEDFNAQEITDPQGMNKLAAEDYHLRFYKRFGINSSSLRLTNTYGPRHQMKTSDGVFNWFIKQSLDKNILKIWGTGETLRDFNYVDDVVDAFLRVMASEKTNGEVYNLGSCIKRKGRFEFLQGNIISIGDLTKKIVEITESGSYQMEPYPEERKSIEPGHFYADIQKINSAVGWEPKVSIEEGIRRTIKFYKENKLHYW